MTGDHQATPETPKPETPASVELADSPSVDFLANRYRFHAGGADRLQIPLAGEGLRKYCQELFNPWGDVVERDGERGRPLRKRSTELRIPWRGAKPEAIAVRVHGRATISMRVNGTSVGSRKVAGGWQTARFPGGKIREGENEIAIAARGKVLWQSLAIGPELDGGEAPAVALDPVSPFDAGGETKKALTGAGRFSLYTEIPETGYLDLETGASAPVELTITATPAGGEPAVLLSARQQPGWQRRTISLARLAGQLVVLDLATSDGAATGWTGRIALEAAKVAKRPPPLDNAVVVVVDAMRADKLEVYAPKTRVKAPRMNGETARRGAAFLDNQAASPSSPPSHGSIQTGMIPRVHGVVGDTAKLRPGTPMLSTQARAAGLAAGYYGNNSFGMGRLEKPGNWTAFHQPAREGKGFDCSALIPEMLGFIKAQTGAGKRFVLSSLPYETHVPYRYHEGITDQYHAGPWRPPVGKKVTGGFLGKITGGRVKLDETGWAQLKALYDGEVTYFDGCFGQLLDGIDKLGITDKTAVVLTSDHGDGMFEHGHMGHAWGHHGELGNVPMVVFAPGITDGGKVVDVPTSHIDIVPTVLDLLGVDIDPRVQGRSLVPLMLRDGPWTPRLVSLEYGRSHSLRARRWRYIVAYDQTETLYDLARDPTEQTDVANTRPIAMRYMRDAAGFFLAHRSRWTNQKWGDLVNHKPAFVAAMR